MTLRHVRYPILVIGLFSLVLPQAAAFGQQSSTVPVVLNFKVPVTLRNIHPAIATVKVTCSASFYSDAATGAHAGFGQSASVPVSSLQRAADGSYSGDFNVTVNANVPADGAGKRGQYGCRTEGCLSSGALQYYGGQCGPFTTGHPEEPRLLVRAPQPGVSSVEFTW